MAVGCGGGGSVERTAAKWRTGGGLPYIVGRQKKKPSTKRGAQGGNIVRRRRCDWSGGGGRGCTRRSKAKSEKVPAMERKYG